MLIIDRIVEILKEKNLTQADICKYLSIKSNVFTTWKTRKTDPPTKYLVQICDFLNVSLEYLLTGKESTPKATTMEMPKQQLTKKEERLLEYFKNITDEDQLLELGRLSLLAEQNTKNKENVG